MPTCTFFGHRHTPSRLYAPLIEAIEALIREHGVDNFLLGNQGDFDAMALKALRELQQKYSHIKYTVVLAYHPSLRPPSNAETDETVFPDELDKVHPRYAVDKRNRYMVAGSDFVISYALIDGGAMKFTKLAQRSEKTVISINQEN